MTQFGVLTFNMLAQKYVREAALSDRKLLDPATRFAALKTLPHIQKVDIVCLQEVDLDVAPEVWIPWFQTHGFDHVLQTRRKNLHTVGCATFYRENRFRLVWQDIRSRALLTGFLAVSQTENTDILYVVNTHLEGRAIQAVKRIQQITSALKSLNRRLTHETAPSKIIVCGDFNSFHVDAPFQLLTTGKLAKGFTEDDIVVVPDKDIEIPFSLTSAFTPGKTCPVTYISKRSASTIDWILYSPNSLTCVDRMHCVDSHLLRDILSRTRLPIPDHPSDHVPIAAIFTSKQN